MKDYILIEPMIAPSIIVYLRLLEALEKVFRGFKIDYYTFRIEPHRIKYLAFLDKVKKDFAVEDLGERGGFFYFRRWLNEDLYEARHRAAG